MKIQVKDKSHNGKVFVRNMTWQKRCEEQLNQIISELTNIKSNLETSKMELEGILHE